MTQLNKRFGDRSQFAPEPNYRLLPFRFHRLGTRVIVTNDVGEWVMLQGTEFDSFVGRTLRTDESAYRKLKSRHFLFDRHSRSSVDLLALKIRSRSEPIAEFTALHIFVVTLRCDHSCHYCQVSRQTENANRFDMSHEHAEKALALVFRSPARNLKIEFQGGEPLLAFDSIKFIVEKAEQLNQKHKRTLAFVIATNLSQLTDEALRFCKDHNVQVSTSLDGPRDLHDAKRPLRDGSSYERTISGIRKAREALGDDAVSALMTTSPESLNHVEAILDEYVRQGFTSIFLRNMSPYGFATKSLIRRYDVDDWLSFYRRGLAHIIRLNQGGTVLREEFATILLQKMFSPEGAPYVDLQSPAGIGIGGIVYNYDGHVFASDEGRMLAEMGDDSLRIGHVDTDNYSDIMWNPKLLDALEQSLLESSPRCTDCAFLPYCGADPSFHRATQDDWVGHKSFSDFCRKQTGVLEFLISLLEDEPQARGVLMEWI